AASSSAWTVPSSPNGPWRGMKTTGTGARAARRSMAAPTLTGPPAPRAGGAVDAGAEADRAVGAEGGRVIVVRGRPALAPVNGGQPPPAAVKIDEELLDLLPGRPHRPGHAAPRHDSA